jgi:hypothetical protein
MATTVSPLPAQSVDAVPDKTAGLRLPPSAKKIFALFSDGNTYTVQELRKRTGYSIRCTRYAVQLLKKNRMIVAKFNFRDARQTLYRISGDEAGSLSFSSWPYIQFRPRLPVVP